MNNTKKILLFQDRLITLGLAFVAISATIFYITDKQAGIIPKAGLGAFFFNYGLSIFYSLAVFIGSFNTYRWRISARRIEYTILILILWFIAAFSLNREMNVFDSAVDWLCILIHVSCVALILTVFKQALPFFLKLILYFFLGIAFLMFLYYAVYLTPLYVMSVIATIVLGVGLHSFVPLWISILIGVLAYRSFKENRALAYSFLSGLGVSLIFCAWFVIQWSSISKDINIAINRNTLTEGKLPLWTIISQNSPKNFISERVIKADLVYKVMDTNGSFWWGNFKSNNFDEPQKHDPLVVLASLFCGTAPLDVADRIKILESIYDSRHQAQERLWSGDKLQTTNIVSNVKIFPEYRLAYTEKILSIKNTEDGTWRQEQEAIYTFHLPEGSVVTSLSLWVKGKEQKAYLTTKAKADSAYKTIVGVERRDPSVIHWQEGNTVSVRVFPCTSAEKRKFKIGITSPLRKDNDQLIYENCYFDGPNGSKATETVQLAFSKKPNQFQAPAGFLEATEGVYQSDRTYQPYWEISCKAPQLSKEVFSFADTTYQLKEYTSRKESFVPETIYLDLNSSWSETELMEVWESIKLKPVYVMEDKAVKLTDENIHSIFTRTAKQNFSLFPLYEIQNPDKALVISKSAETSPNLHDLKGSEFQSNLTNYLKTPKSIRFYTIGYQLSPYLKALKEFRILNYQHGTVTDLQALLKTHQFSAQQENENQVVIHNARLMIEKKKGTEKGTAPDHLLRLFAYNDIMQKVGANYFNDQFIKPEIIAEAEKAYVVSPVSSLIVLESQADYDKFDIKGSKNSLENASMKSSGAVPEPHEWLLIILTLGVAVFLTYKPKFLKQA